MKKLPRYLQTAVLMAMLMIYTVSAYSANNSNFDGSAWDKAVKIYKENQHLKPYLMNVYSQTWDGKGNLEKTEEQEYRLSYKPNGETDQTLIRALEDGMDITDKKKKEVKKNSGHGGRPSGDNKGMDKIPFDPEVQDDVIAADTGKIEYKNGRNCSLWNFNLKLNDKYNAEGKAWLSLQTGEAVSLEYSLVPSFPFVEEMNISLNFITDKEHRCLLDVLRFDGKVNMLIMKKSFTAVTSFSDYR